MTSPAENASEVNFMLLVTSICHTTSGATDWGQWDESPLTSYI